MAEGEWVEGEMFGGGDREREREGCRRRRRERTPLTLHHPTPLTPDPLTPHPTQYKLSFCCFILINIEKTKKNKKRYN